MLCAIALGADRALAQTVGVAVAVTQGAVIERSGGATRLSANDTISSGDAIRTDPNGLVQLLFRDQTRIVVGPNTRFEIDDVALGGNGLAQRFAVSSVGGLFRILSGNSPKPAYEIRTPTATMGIRGTIFDVAVEGRDTTRLVTLDGAVQFCGRRCAVVTGGCAVARIDNRGRIRPPEDQRERDAVLNSAFPFVTDQRPLASAFRAPVERCGDIDSTVFLAQPPVTAPAPPVSNQGGDGGGATNGGGSSGSGGGGQSGSGGGGSQKDDP